MDSSLAWWQVLLIGLSCLGLAVVVGLGSAHLILRVRRRARNPLARSLAYAIPQEQFFPAAQTGLPPRAATQNVQPQIDPIAEYVQKRIPSPSKAEIAPRKSALLLEIEANLEIAVAAEEGKLTPFRTEAFDLKQASPGSLSEQVMADLEEAYTDMRLANTLVWLSKDLGRNGSEVGAGYLRLCAKVAERLETIIPRLGTSSRQVRVAEVNY
jgi:hypothetical protein